MENETERNEVENVDIMAPEAIVENAKIVYGRRSWKEGLASDAGCTVRYVEMMLTDKTRRRPFSDTWNMRFQEAIKSARKGAVERRRAEIEAIAAEIAAINAQIAA